MSLELAFAALIEKEGKEKTFTPTVRERQCALRKVLHGGPKIGPVHPYERQREPSFFS